MPPTEIDLDWQAFDANRPAGAGRQAAAQPASSGLETVPLAPASVAAIKAVQKFAGLPVTGHLDPATVAYINGHHAATSATGAAGGDGGSASGGSGSSAASAAVSKKAAQKAKTKAFVQREKTRMRTAKHDARVQAKQRERDRRVKVSEQTRAGKAKAQTLASRKLAQAARMPAQDRRGR